MTSDWYDTCWVCGAGIDRKGRGAQEPQQQDYATKQIRKSMLKFLQRTVKWLRHNDSGLFRAVLKFLPIAMNGSSVQECHHRKETDQTHNEKRG